MSRISSVRGWEALDSRGRPTVACRVELDDGATGTALVPSGASAGSHEALELRDGGPRYGGRGVRTAVAHVNGPLAGAVRGVDVVADLPAVDAALLTSDRSPGFGVLGANAVLAVSLAAALAAADSSGVSLARLLDPRGPLLLPMPMVNVISGGAHAGGLIDVQDFLAVPLGATSLSEAVEWSVAVRDATAALAVRRGHRQAVLVADEGGLGLPLSTNRDALELLTDGISSAGLAPGTQVGIAIDVAASELLTGGTYRFGSEGRDLSAAELVDEVTGWCEDFPVVSVEDLLGEDDWSAWAMATVELGSRVHLVGDDLFATQVDRLRHGIELGAAGSVLVKVNQNGLLSGAGDVVRAAHAAGYRTVVSARSGDTEDSWLADLAVGWRAGQIKVGSTQRSERTAKWNRLLELEALEHTTFANPWHPPAPAAPDERRST
ncbi:MAG TPA: phosphopyruvate hydratase [Actinomycetales bacterium]